MELDEKVVAISRSLDGARVPHSFGGALALSYYAQPRLTHDIDINVYLRVGGAAVVLDAFASLGMREPTAAEMQTLNDTGQVRIRWDRTPLDLFFSNLPFHDSCMERRQRRRFGEVDIDVLSAEDLLVCKVAFGRPKDREDIRQMLGTIGGELDLRYAAKWIDELLARDDERRADFGDAVREHGLKA